MCDPTEKEYQAKMLEYCLKEPKMLPIVLGYPKMGRRGVMDSVLQLLLTNTDHPTSSHTQTQNRTARDTT